MKQIFITVLIILSFGCTETSSYEKKLASFCVGEKVTFDLWPAPILEAIENTQSFSFQGDLRYEVLNKEMELNGMYYRYDIKTFMFDDQSEMLNQIVFVLNTPNDTEQGKKLREGASVWFYKTPDDKIDYLRCTYSLLGGWYCSNYGIMGSIDMRHEPGTKLFLKSTP